MLLKHYGFVILFSLVIVTPIKADEALDEVNAKRAEYGLPPFLRCKWLTKAAQAAADYRAAHLLEGHTNNDFQFVPSACHADASGCAAWRQGTGWGACCTYDREYRWAGAAWTIGRDGRRYMHLFVAR